MSFEEIVKWNITKALSGEQIKELIGKEPIPFSKLKNYKSLNQVLGNEGYTVIFYEQSQYEGHYVALFLDGNGVLNYMDPYGFQPLEVKSKVAYDEYLPNYLTDLIKANGRNIIISNTDYQAKVAGVADCGRHACCRIKLRHLSNKQYETLLLTSKIPILKPDFIVTAMTLLCLKGDILNFYNK